MLQMTPESLRFLTAFDRTDAFFAVVARGKLTRLPSGIVSYIMAPKGGVLPLAVANRIMHHAIASKYIWVGR